MKIVSGMYLLTMGCQSQFNATWQPTQAHSLASPKLVQYKGFQCCHYNSVCDDLQPKYGVIQEGA